MASSDGAAALAAIDRALADRPEKDGYDFAEASKHLSRYRDRLIAQHRDEPPTPAVRERLARLNAVLGVVLGGQFPLGAIPWTEINLARDWLAGLLAEEKDQPSGERAIGSA